MAKKYNYNCILYEIGDKVIEKYGESNEVLEIENTELKYIGVYPCLFLKFKGKEFDNTKFSNLFEPAEETIEKYKDGLKYFEEVKVTVKTGSTKKTNSKSAFTFRPKRAEKKEEIDLTDESIFKTKVIKSTFFKPPIRKESGSNETKSN